MALRTLTRCLRAATRVAVVSGAAVAVALTLRAGRHTDFRLVTLFVIWVLSPFIVLGTAGVLSKRWSALTRAALHIVTLLVALGSPVVYAVVALGPPRPKPAFLFLVVPLASWLLIAIAIPLAAHISGRQSRRAGGA